MPLIAVSAGRIFNPTNGFHILRYDSQPLKHRLANAAANASHDRKNMPLLTPLKPHHWPWTFVVFTILGTACLVVGIAALAGLLAGMHPLFRDELAGWGLIVSAIACFLTGAFPLVLRRLAEREGA